VVSYDTDEEQIEAIKNWWKENGKSLLLTVAGALIVVFGFQTWQNSARETGEAISDQYEDLRAAVSSSPLPDTNQLKTARYLTDSLIEEHPDSTYAQFAALQMAKLSVEQGDLEAARSELTRALEDADSGPISSLITIRLARIELAEGNSSKALETLEKSDSNEYASTRSELKGDIYLQMGKPEQARASYQEALYSLPANMTNPILELKLDDIPARKVSAPTQPTAAQESDPEVTEETPTED
jgi:predicted negative regulator of RcsB-dependent stress response